MRNIKKSNDKQMGASESKIDEKDLESKVGELSCILKYRILDKLIELNRSQPNEVYNVLNNIMQPCEIVYFVEKMLPMLSKNAADNESSDIPYRHTKNMTYLNIYESIINNAEKIIPKINGAAQTAGTRKLRKKKKDESTKTKIYKQKKTVKKV